MGMKGNEQRRNEPSGFRPVGPVTHPQPSDELRRPFQSHLVLRRGERFLVGRTVERISRQRSMDSVPVDDVAPRLLCLQSPFIHQHIFLIAAAPNPSMNRTILVATSRLATGSVSTAAGAS
jgi:hypothetical protein